MKRISTRSMNVASRTRSCSFKKDCGICRERVQPSSFINTKGCGHGYCSDCCKQYAEVKFMTGSPYIKCPHENCNKKYTLLQCKRMLSKKHFDILRKRHAEALTPPLLRFYCPYKDCSAFMKKPKANDNIGTFAECYSCHRGFCIECNIPWHSSKTCGEFRAHAENSRLKGDKKLRDLAKHMKWQICQRCERVIERTYGCNQMTCLCGNHFCYNCGGKFGHGHEHGPGHC